jgi:hypothetical protein
MSRSIAIVVGAAILLAAGMSVAQDAKVPAPKSSSAAQSGSPGAAQMNEHMTRMQALHEKLATAATPDERQALMAEQRLEMQQGMAMMDDMQGMQHGGPMMGGAGSGMKGKAVDQKTQMQMMDQRMDMMQLMMQSMMDQQGASGSPVMPAPTR